MKRWIVGFFSLFVVIAFASVTLAADPRAVVPQAPPAVQSENMPPMMKDLKGGVIQKTGTAVIAVKYSATGMPLDGAQVWIERGPSKPPTQITNAQGVATFTNLLNGPYTFGVTKAGYNPNVTTVSANVAGNTTTTTIMLNEEGKMETKDKGPKTKQKGGQPQ